MSISRLFDKIFNTKNAAEYYFLSLRNRYPCKIVGEKFNENTHETIVMYKVLPKKEEFEIRLKDLLENQSLLEKFHPTQTVKLGFMAFGEIFFNQPKENAYEKYRDIIDKMSSGEQK